MNQHDNQLTGQSEHMAPRRRALLTGGAGFAVLAGAAIGIDGAQPALATASGSGPDWINATSTPYNADRNGQKDSTGGINQALAAAAPGQVVYLPAGIYKTTAPLVFPTSGGVSLRGAKGGTASGSGAGKGLGTTIRPASNWQQGSPGPGVISIVAGSPGAAVDLAADVRDLWIDCASIPSTTVADGIAALGEMNGVVIRDVGVNHATGKGFAQYTTQDTSGRVHFALGWQLFDCIAQGRRDLEGVGGTGQAGDAGYFLTGTDAGLVNCHAQWCIGDGFVIQAGNNRLIGCRGDLSRNGFTVDAGSGGGYLDATSLVGCGTQRNQENGLNVINASTTGTGKRGPVVVSGCTFDGDGVNGASGGGSYAGIRLSGLVLATITDCQVLVHTEDVPNPPPGLPAPGCPQYAVRTVAAGTGNGKPALLQITGGFFNSVSTTIISDAAPAGLRQVSAAGFGGAQYSGQQLVRVT